MYKCIKKSCDGTLSGIILAENHFVQCNLCKALYKFEVEAKPFEGSGGKLIIIIDESEDRHQIDKIEVADYKEWYDKFYKIRG